MGRHTLSLQATNTGRHFFYIFTNLSFGSNVKKSDTEAAVAEGEMQELELNMLKHNMMKFSFALFLKLPF